MEVDVKRHGFCYEEQAGHKQQDNDRNDKRPDQELGAEPHYDHEDEANADCYQRAAETGAPGGLQVVGHVCDPVDFDAGRDLLVELLDVWQADSSDIFF